MAEEHALEAGDGNGLLLEGGHDPLQGLQQSRDQLVGGRGHQGTHLGEQRFQLRGRQCGDLGSLRLSHGYPDAVGNPWRAGAGEGTRPESAGHCLAASGRQRRWVFT